MQQAQEYDSISKKRVSTVSTSKYNSVRDQERSEGGGQMPIY